MANLKELEDLQNDIVRDHIRPWLRRHGSLPSGVGGQDYPSPGPLPDYPLLLRDAELEQLAIDASLYGPLLDSNLVQLLDFTVQIRDRIRGSR